MDLSQHDRPSTVPSSEVRPAEVLAKRRFGLVAAVGLIFLVAGVLTVFAVTRLRKTSTSILRLFPRDSAAVYWIDLPRLRSISSLQQLRRDILAIPEVQRTWDPVVLGCTFDPIDRTGIASFSIPRATTLSTFGSIDNFSPVMVLTGEFTAPEAQRCLQSLAQNTQSSDVVQRTSIAGRTVLALVRRSDPSLVGVGSSDAGTTPLPTPTESQFAVENRMIVSARASEIPGALRVIDRQSPGADVSDRIRNMFSTLGGGVLFAGIVDNQFAMGTSAVSTSQLLSSISNGDPALNGFTPLFSATMSASALQMSTSGYRFVLLYQFNNTADAVAARDQTQQAIAAVRGLYLNGINQAQTKFTQEIARAQTTTPGVTAHVPAVSQGFAVATGLIDRVRLRVDGKIVRLEVELTTNDFDALINAVRGAIAIQRLNNQVF